MDIKYRLYPYPVLTSFNDDYISSKFHVNAECVLDGFDICINYSVELENDQIRDLISHGKACIVFHLESARTGYREAKETDKFNGKIVIKDSFLNGDLNFCPFIIAKESIPNYFNSDFNEDYTEPVKLEKGYLLAIGNQIIWPINKNNIDLLNSSSPFRIGLNPDESVSNMVVEFESQPKIRILLSSKDLSCYKNMNNTTELKSILNSAVVVPALIYVLSELKQCDDMESTFGSLSWYSAIKESYRKNFKKEITVDLANENVFELAQKMLKTPINAAFEDLTTLGGHSNDEEEDDNEI